MVAYSRHNRYSLSFIFPSEKEEGVFLAQPHIAPHSNHVRLSEIRLEDSFIFSPIARMIVHMHDWIVMHIWNRIERPVMSRPVLKLIMFP